MSSLQVNRLTSFLQSLLLLGRGTEKPVPEINDEIQPVIVVEPHWAEHLHLGGWRRYSTSDRQQAGGAFNTRIQFAPAVRDMLYVIEHIRLSTATAQRMQLWLTDINGVTGPDAGAPSQHTLDNRSSDGVNNDIGQNCLSSFLGDVATLGQRIFEHQINNNLIYEWTVPIVMVWRGTSNTDFSKRPALQLRGATVNTLIELSVDYRIRPAERSE